MRNLAIPVALSLIIALSGLCAAPLFFSPSLSAEETISPLLALRDAYRNLESIHFRAHFKMTLYDHLNETELAGTGSYEYWQEGERYRIHSSSERGMGLTNDFDILFDGYMFYLLNRDLSLLSYQIGDASNHPTALPNPLTLMFEYLDVEPPDCADCRLRLRDLGDDNHWKKRTRGAQLGMQKSGDTIVHIPITGSDSTSIAAFTIHLFERGGSYLPRRIDRVDRDGRALLSIRFHSYASMSTDSGNDLEVPERIEVIAYSDTNGAGERVDEIVLQASITLKSIDINQPIAESIFQMDFSQAARIWDGDARMFIGRP